MASEERQQRGADGSRDERLESVESAQAFTDRTVEQLSEQIIGLHARLDRLTGLIERLEGRIEGLEVGDEAGPDDPPPHSSDRKPERGPPGPMA